MGELTRRTRASVGGGLAAALAMGRSAWARAKPAAAKVVKPAGIDPLMMVDPELRAAAAERQRAALPLSFQTLPTRRHMSAPQGPPKASPPSAERMIPGRGGAPDVRVFVIRAAMDKKLRPAVLHIHGGGYVVGSAEMFLAGAQATAAQHDCVVVTVDYRLAPETPFPGALEDNYAALSWLHAHADELGVDRTRIAVKGESAGGGHAAALTIAARDRGEVPIAFQCLIYPMLDDRTGTSRPVPAHMGAYGWTPANNRFGWTSLLGVPAGSPIVPPSSVPARVENLAGLPPAFIGVGSIDLFMAEDVDYARLIEAGVQTELYVAPGGFHGFSMLDPAAKISVAFNKAWNDALGRALAARG